MQRTNYYKTAPISLLSINSVETVQKFTKGCDDCVRTYVSAYIGKATRPNFMLPASVVQSVLL